MLTLEARTASWLTGAVVSTIKEILSATAACVSVAALPAASRSVPPLSARLLAKMLMPFVSVSPARMVYVKTNCVLPVPEA